MLIISDMDDQDALVTSDIWITRTIIVGRLSIKNEMRVNEKRFRKKTLSLHRNSSETQIYDL